MDASNGPLSWRDIFKAVNQSEDRLTEYLQDLRTQITAVDDRAEHRFNLAESRIEALEIIRLAEETVRLEHKRLAGISRNAIITVATVASVVGALITAFVNGG